jgi:PKD repeat protein
MTLRLYFLILMIFLLPQYSLAAVSMHTFKVELSFDTTELPEGKTLAGYKLYQDNDLTIPVCDKTDFIATSATTYTITCSVATDNLEHTYQLSAYYLDGSESDKSPQFSFTATDADDSTGGGDETGGDVISPPTPTGSQLISYSWETNATNSDIAGYRMYMNDEILCESSDSTITSLSCSADLVNEVMTFSITSFDDNAIESLKSNFLVLDPADFPEIFQKKSTVFTWDYSDPTSSAGGFQVFSNDQLLCQTDDSTATSLECVIDILQPKHTFTVAAVSSTGELTTFSNSIVYDTTSTSTTDLPSGVLVANISSAPTSGPAPLAVTFSAANSTGSISSYKWDFGDGDKGSTASTTHTYTIPGTYSASLEIFDSLGNSALTSVSIQADEVVSEPVPPTAVLSSSTAAGEAPLSVSFDGSSSTATNATILSHNWDFGDGTKGTGTTISHLFTVAGTYSTELLVADNLGLTDTETTPVIVTPATTVNLSPAATFSSTPQQGPSPLTVYFDGSSSSDPDGTISAYTWNFGDGSKGTGKTVQHTYTSAATYTATLQVTDDLGANSPTATKTITAEEATPVVVLNYEIGGLALTDEWVRINFENTFNNPVVFLSPPTNNDAEAVVTRVRNLDKLGFEVRLQEWDYLDGIHTLETVNYLALEQGQVTLPDGTIIESGVFNGSTSKQTISYKNAFTSAPVVLTTIISENEKDAVVGRLSSVTSTSFSYLFQEQEKTKTNHVTESVAYVAWSTGSGSVDMIQFAVAIPSVTITNNLTAIPFQDSFQDLPFLFSEQQSMTGGDTAALRVQNLTKENVELFLQEEQSKDSEVSHTSETIGYIGIISTTPENDLNLKQVIFSWEFEPTHESEIIGFIIKNNGLEICETMNPFDRTITCEIIIDTDNSFEVVAIETSSNETLPSKSIQYKP